MALTKIKGEEAFGRSACGSSCALPSFRQWMSTLDGWPSAQRVLPKAQQGTLTFLPRNEGEDDWPLPIEPVDLYGRHNLLFLSCAAMKPSSVEEPRSTCAGL